MSPISCRNPNLLRAFCVALLSLLWFAGPAKAELLSFGGTRVEVVDGNISDEKALRALDAIRRAYDSSDYAATISYAELLISNYGGAHLDEAYVFSGRGHFMMGDTDAALDRLLRAYYIGGATPLVERIALRAEELLRKDFLEAFATISGERQFNSGAILLWDNYQDPVAFYPYGTIRTYVKYLALRRLLTGEIPQDVQTALFEAYRREMAIPISALTGNSKTAYVFPGKSAQEAINRRFWNPLYHGVLSAMLDEVYLFPICRDANTKDQQVNMTSYSAGPPERAGALPQLQLNRINPVVIGRTFNELRFTERSGGESNGTGEDEMLGGVEFRVSCRDHESYSVRLGFAPASGNHRYHVDLQSGRGASLTYYRDMLELSSGTVFHAFAEFPPLAELIEAKEGSLFEWTGIFEDNEKL